MSSDTRPQDYTRNALCFGLDLTFFNTAMSFISTTTVLLTFLATLTSNTVLIGVASGILNGAWLLPQLLVAGIAARQKRQKPMCVKSIWLTRPVLVPLALAVWLLTPTHPGLVFVLTVLAIFIFFVGDAFASVPWFSLLARTLPTRRRGRVTGLGQVVGGLGGIGAGFVVRQILSEGGRWSYPANYAVLIIIASLIFTLSSIAVLFMREPAAPAENDKPAPALKEVLRSMPSLLAGDHSVRWMIVTKVVLGFGAVSSSFFVLYATQQLDFAVADTGYFVTAQVAGSVGSGLLLSYIQDHWGPLRHMRILMVLTMIPPALALLAGAAQGSAPHLTVPLYLALYFFFGVAWSNIGWPFFNWILEYAAEDKRPLYIGLTNTLGAITMLAPTIGGLLVRNVSYASAFVVSIAFAVLSLIMSFRLPSPRQEHEKAAG